jgi:hypothetical protein
VAKISPEVNATNLARFGFLNVMRCSLRCGF